MLIDKESFFRFQQGMSHVPYEQAEGWHDYQLHKKKCKAVYFVDDIVKPAICAWGLVRSIPLVGKILQIYGESYNDIPSKAIVKDFYEQVVLYSKKRFFMVHVSGSSLYDVNYEIGIRQAGFLRPLVLTTCPLSIIVDLTENNRKTSRTWMLRMREAQKKDLQFEYVGNPNLEQIGIVCQMYAEMAHNKNLEYGLNANSLNILLKDDRFKLFFVSTSNNQRLLARIVYVYNKCSYDIIAANSTASRGVRGSSYFMVSAVLSWLKNNDIELFDFGRIGPGKRSTNSVYEFKSYIGGIEVAYNGEWVYANNKLLESILYFLINVKRHRY